MPARDTATPQAPGRDRGFTLIEILIVVSIIGLLAGIATPVYLNQRNKAALAVTKQQMHELTLEVVTARENTGTTLLGVTGSNCSDCACRTIGTILRTADPTFLGSSCGASWTNQVNKVADAAGVPRTQMARLMTDGWGRPILFDENEGEAGVGGCPTFDVIGSAGSDNSAFYSPTRYGIQIPHSGLC